MARRNKPHDPAKAMREAIERRRRDFDAVNLDPASVGLPSFADVMVERAGKKAGTNRAWRSNVFRLLLERKTITADHYEAAYLLATDWAIWKGLDGKAESFGEFVDGGAGCAELVTDRMIKAGRRIYGDQERGVVGALETLPRISRTILEAFMVATVEEDRPMAWRGVMERIGITSRDMQPKFVVGALEALRRVYQEPGRAAA